MNFAEVTDVVIPQGSVTKIAETDSGRVLWEKGLPIPQAHWEYVDYADTSSRDYNGPADFVDIDDGLEIFLHINNKPCRIKYNADGTLGDAYSLGSGTKLPADISGEKTLNEAQYADIDPVSKIWVVCNKQRVYTSNAFDVIKWQDPLSTSTSRYVRGCCWSPKLKRFCIVGDNKTYYTTSYDNVIIFSFLVNTSGEITNLFEQSFYGQYPGNADTQRTFFWSDKLEKFVYHFHTGVDTSSDDFNTSVFLSSDGLNWGKKKIANIGDLSEVPDNIYARRQFDAICWMQSVGKFIAISSNNYDRFVYKSSDCINWEYVTTLSSLFRYEARCAYSPERKVLAVVGRSGAYLTRDLENWVAIPRTGTSIDEVIANPLIWSKTLNSFVHAIDLSAANANRLLFYKLVMDN